MAYPSKKLSFFEKGPGVGRVGGGCGGRGVGTGSSNEKQQGQYPHF